ncbi:cytochrome c biogenesis protein ResB, partial [Nocardiopsis alba]
MTTTTSETSENAPSGKRSEPGPKGIGVLGWARWIWRTLTSMRTALILLFLLAVGAIPGSFLPQNVVSV